MHFGHRIIFVEQIIESRDKNEDEETGSSCDAVRVSVLVSDNWNHNFLNNFIFSFSSSLLSIHVIMVFISIAFWQKGCFVRFFILVLIVYSCF